MSTPDDYASTLHDLRQQAVGLARTAQETNRYAREALERAEAVDATAVRRVELRARLRWAAAIIAAGMVATIIGGLVTFRVTIDRENRDITRCFLGPGRLDPAQVTYCETRFPGYGDLQRRSADASRKFDDLLKEIPRNRELIGELQERVTELEAVR
jgi:hypothetical protein